MICATLDCENDATRTHTWRKLIQIEETGPRGGKYKVWAPEGDEVCARYCETCSYRMRTSDMEIDPPWPEAKVLQFRPTRRRRQRARRGP